jgi:hypothetical protein
VAIVTLTGASISSASASTTAAAPAVICPHGTHWDNVLQACV